MEIKFDYMIRSEESSAIVHCPYTLDQIEESSRLLDIKLDGRIVAKRRYTGIKDEAGKEIYEGDIVECVEKEMFNKRKNHIKFISPVFWDDCGWSLHESATCDTSLAVYDNSNPTKLPITRIKVIGNIYENRKLLEEK